MLRALRIWLDARPVAEGRALLAVETLEDRLLPTVAITPHFGPESVTRGSGPQLSSTPVYLVLAGTSWGSPSASPSRPAVEAAARALLATPFLSKLSQYGGDGKATYGGSIVAPGLPASFTDAQLQQLLAAQIQAGALPQPGTQHPLFVVVSPAGVQLAGSPKLTAYHGQGSYGGSVVPYLWLSAQGSSSANPDALTSSLSQQLADTVTDPDGRGVHLSPPSALPAALRQGNEVADEEAAGRYAVRLAGVRVSASWSKADGVFVVADGNRQTFTLTPLWNGSSFTGRYDLVVNGDQRGANTPDSVVLDQTPAGGVRVSLNGETASFDAGTIRNVTVGTGGGANQVTVAALPVGVAVNVTGGKGSTDTVQLGNSGHFLGQIQGTVDVTNPLGQSTLVIDTTVGQGGDVTLTQASVAFFGQTIASYTSAVTWFDGSRHQVTGVLFRGGGYGDLTVGSTAPDTPVTASTGAGQSAVTVLAAASPVSIQTAGQATVQVGTGTLAGITAPVTVTSAGGSTALHIDDFDEAAARTLTITRGAVSFSGLAPVSYSGVASLDVRVPLGTTSATIPSTSCPLTLRGGFILPVHLGDGNAADLAGSVDLSQGNFGLSLTVDDGSDPDPEDVTVAGTSLTLQDARTSRTCGPVLFNGLSLSELHFLGGPGGISATIDDAVSSSWGVPALFLVPSSPHDLVYLNAWHKDVHIDSPSGTDFVKIGDGSLSRIQGTVSISNTSGKTDVELDASADSNSHQYTINANSVSTDRMTIRYTGASLQPGGSLVGGVSSLELYTSGYFDSFVVNGVPPNVPVSIYARFFASLSGPAAQAVRFQRSWF